MKAQIELLQKLYYPLLEAEQKIRVRLRSVIYFALLWPLKLAIKNGLRIIRMSFHWLEAHQHIAPHSPSKRDARAEAIQSIAGNPARYF